MKSLLQASWFVAMTHSLCQCVSAGDGLHHSIHGSAPNRKWPSLRKSPIQAPWVLTSKVVFVADDVSEGDNQKMFLSEPD